LGTGSGVQNTASKKLLTFIHKVGKKDRMILIFKNLLFVIKATTRAVTTVITTPTKEYKM